MNRFRVQNLMIFVLFLGPVACTLDKPKQREDQWRFAPPEIVMPSSNDGERERLKVGEASQNELPLAAELSFSAMTSAVSLEISSRCSHDGANFEEDFRIQGEKTLAFGAIVPARALLVTGKSFLDCSFDFSAVNEHGSQHHFLISGVKLSGAPSYGALVVSEKLKRISPVASAEEKATVKVDDLDQIALDSDAQSGTAELACADFTSRVTFRSVDSINWKQLAYKQPIEVLEKVLSKFRQPCRLALRDESGNRVEISAPFTLVYPAPELLITAQTPAFSGPTSEKIRDISILNFKLSNTSNIDQFLELQNTSADPRVVWSERASPGNSTSNFYYWFNIHRTAEISYSITGSEKVIAAGGKTIFVVKANSEVDVNVIANSYYLNSTPGSVHSGYLFLLPQPIRLKRLEVVGDLDVAIAQNKVQVAEEISIFKMFPHHVSETEIYVPNAKLKVDWEFLVRSLTEKPFPSDAG